MREIFKASRQTQKSLGSVFGRVGCRSVRGSAYLWVEGELEDGLGQEPGGPSREDGEVGLTVGGISMQTSQKDISVPAKAVGYTGGGGVEEAAQGPFRNEEHGPEWASLST